MNTPLFTIITTCFNAGEKLNRTLDSVLSQEFRDYEILVKDAGSTDGSIEGMRGGPAVRLVRHEDHGIYDGMNEAVPLANGEYLLFLNCGDLLYDEKVLSAVAAAIRADESRKAQQGGTVSAGAAPHGQERPERQERQERDPDRPVIYYGDVWERRTGQRVAANPDLTHLAMYRNLPCHQACFYSRELFRTRGFDTGYRVRADYEHFLWCVMERGARTEALPVVVADYEGGGFSESEENRRISAREHEEIAARYFSEKELRSFRRYMLLTLQPLREKLSASPATAAFYDGIKNRVYRRKKTGV